MPGRIIPLRVGIIAIWLLMIGAGFAVILKYQNAAGSTGAAPPQWPVGASMSLDPGRDTLIMFAHPRCPCTRASVEELNRLLVQAHGSMAVRVMFFRPRDFPDDWAHTDLWRSAAAIPGVTVAEDLDGTQARLFGAETSGYVLLYDTRGKLLFRGGITGSRGHAGDNAGEEAVVAISEKKDVVLKQTPVFGCSILGDCTNSMPETTK